MDKREKEATETVRRKLIAAVEVMKMQRLTRRDCPQRVQAFWVAYENRGAATGEYRRPSRPKATPEQIREMEFWLDHVLRLEPSIRRIVLARAGRIPWRRLEEMDGRSHTTLRKIEAQGLRELAKVTMPKPVR